MAFSACKGAINAQAIIAVEGCETYMRSLEFIMATQDWQRLSLEEQAQFVERAMDLDKDITKEGEKCCSGYKELLDDIDGALRPERDS